MEEKSWQELEEIIQRESEIISIHQKIMKQATLELENRNKRDEKELAGRRKILEILDPKPKSKPDPKKGMCRGYVANGKFMPCSKTTEFGGRYDEFGNAIHYPRCMECKIEHDNNKKNNNS